MLPPEVKSHLCRLVFTGAGCLSRYESSTIVIMAGYEKDMHEMLERNEGLKSRFQVRLSVCYCGK